ncbi:hypothetical protein NDU88_001850 [Pleurodeles waltl]|uniref:Uncharacterized protein n=1 Tax=Pleurodeles waltl TaxID=8319 RepID=A0AAV7M6G3_PLEWA|nr:hypothetical protein NDU88_001850 [Pleurodeles waltl]
MSLGYVPDETSVGLAAVGVKGENKEDYYMNWDIYFSVGREGASIMLRGCVINAEGRRATRAGRTMVILRLD